MANRIPHPIEGFFLRTTDDLIFDVKGLSHPPDRIIAFVRYAFKKYFSSESQSNASPYHKIYDLVERYDFLAKTFPEYLYHDPMGRGLLQSVPKSKILFVYNPLIRMNEILRRKGNPSDQLEQKVAYLVNKLLELSNVSIETIGLTGSLLVRMHRNTSDIDLVIYGAKEGLRVYNSMSDLFDTNCDICRYTPSELKQLWIARGQSAQINFESFLFLEQKKNLQGKVDDVDFYIRLVLLPKEYPEPYLKTKITDLAEIEITANIANDEGSIFTPCIYYLSEVEILLPNVADKPDRIYSLRGRYCELAKKDDQVHVRGKLERVKIAGKKEYFQLVLGNTKGEFFRKII